MAHDEGDQSMLPAGVDGKRGSGIEYGEGPAKVRLKEKTQPSQTVYKETPGAKEGDRFNLPSKRLRILAAIEKEIAELERNEEEDEEIEEELQDAWEDHLTDCKEYEIKNEELKRLEDYEVYWAVPRSEAKTRPLSLVWVIEKRSGLWKARLCARPFGKVKTRTKDQLYTPTPFPVTVRALLIYAHMYDNKVRIFDVHRAFLHTPIQEDVWIEPPPEWPNPRDEVWHLRCTLYGLQEAMVDFDTHFDNIVQGVTTYEDYPVMNMRRCTADPAAWFSEEIKMVKHVDDGVVVAKEQPMELFLHDLQKYFQLKLNEHLEVGMTQKYLGGLLTRIPSGFFQQCLPQHYESLFAMLGLEHGSSVVTPGDKSDSKRLGEKELPPEEAKLFRRAQGTALFIAQFRPDMMYSSKECSRGMRAPTEGDMRRLKRWTRYALGTRYVGILLRPQFEHRHKLDGQCDSDWAKDLIDRKSTTGVTVMWARSLVAYMSKTQGSVATSVGEAEGYAMGSCAAECLGLKSLLTEMGLEVDIDIGIKSDSATAISSMSRLGLGKMMKHVQVKYLFLQELVRRDRIKLHKVGTKENAVDILTKNTDRASLEFHKKQLGISALPRETEIGATSALTLAGGTPAEQMFEGLRMCLLGFIALLATVAPAKS